MPLFGKKRPEFTNRGTELATLVINKALPEGVANITLESTNGLAKEIAEISYQDAVENFARNTMAGVTAACESAFVKCLNEVIDKKLEDMKRELDSDSFDYLLVETSLSLAARALIAFAETLVSQVADRQAKEWAAELRAGLVKDKETQLLKELLQEWEKELQERQRQRAIKRAEEEAKEWERVRSMDESQRVMEIFEIAEAMKSMKSKPWSAPVKNAEQEAAQKRRDEEEAAAREQDRRDDEEMRKRAAIKAKEKIAETTKEQWALKVISMITVGQDTWLKERITADSPGEFENSCVNLAEQMILAADQDGALDDIQNLVYGQELGKSTRELIPDINAWITNQLWQ
jgi:hypothetical protein